MTTPRPSWFFGFHKAVEMWRLVAAVFVVSVVVFVPVQLVLLSAVGETLGHLPDGGVSDGEILLVLIELLVPVWPALAAALLSGWLALWLWTVLWHAGVVRWFVFSGRRGVRLAEILSRGLLHWWRWARLSLTSAAVLVLVHMATAMAFAHLKERAADLGDDSRLGIYLESGILLCLVAVVLCWLAALRGAWLLGESRRRSAVLAWLAGLWGTIRQPVRSLLTLVLWAVPGFAAAVAPTILGWRFEVLRETIPSTVLGLGGGLITAFCLVGLFLSFAPVIGLAEETTTKDP